MAQLVDVKTGKELKLVKGSGFFQYHHKVVTGDMYATEDGSEQVLVVNREIPVQNLDTPATEVQH